MPALREQVYKAIHPLEIGTTPFVDLPEKSTRRSAIVRSEMRRYVWVRPEVKCEIEFAEWTRDGRLRHASLRQLV